MSHSLFLGFVLHRRDYRDTSLLLELFGIGQGRLAAIAKGARRPRQIASALLQPFQPLWLAVSGRGEVKTLTAVEAAGPPFALIGPALVSGFYLNELLLRLLARQDPHDRLFVFYQAALAGLAEGAELERSLRRFECQLLAELGYGLNLERVADDGSPVMPERVYIYDCESGPRALDSGAQGPRVSGATLLALARDDALDPVQRREARNLLRHALAPHLGGRPMQSRELHRHWFGRAPCPKP
ncbi:DNA repair protein RecO [Caldichromatium japonicum]|uniref:DNA repair protein RecO n=1 Tax=Caldichromatium japonicum TaxID=2699430 RepID=UPI0031B59EEC